MKVTQEVADSLSLGLAVGEVPEQSSSVQYYDFIEATIPATSPYEIPLTGVTTALANSTSVLVTMFGSGAWNSASSGQTQLNLNRVSGSPNTGEFKVDTSTPGSEKLVFNVAQAGAPIVISYLKTATNKLTIGLDSSPVIPGSLYFSGLLISDEFPNGAVLICPSITKTSAFQYKTGAVPTIENVFQLGTPSGYRSPVVMIFL